MNRRVYKIHWNKKECQTWTYIYQGMNEIGAYTKDEITELRLLGKGLGAEIGAAVAMELQGKVFAPVHDSNGNVVSLLDTRLGLVCDCHRYTAFGTETLLDENAYSPWRFASKRRDPETGFIYFGHRYYAPEMGRFITADPLGFDAGPNLYAYVCNNPLTHFDEYGLEAVSTTASKSSNAGTNNGKVSTSSASSSWSIGSIVSSVGSFMSDVGTYVVDALSSPRVQGTLQTIGGAGEAIVGGSAVLFSEGLAAPIGVPVMIHGLDNMFTGLQTCWYGTTLSTATSMCMQNMGMSHEMAEIIDGGLSIAGPCGAGRAVLKSMGYTASKISNLSIPFSMQERLNLCALRKENSNLLFQSWNKGTFPNRMQSLKYHLQKHGNGRSYMEYTEDAIDFFNLHKDQATRVTLKNDLPGFSIKLKVNGQRAGGFWTESEEIITFWD